MLQIFTSAYLPAIRHSQISTLKTISSQLVFYYMNIWINILSMMVSH